MRNTDLTGSRLRSAHHTDHTSSQEETEEEEEEKKKKKDEPRTLKSNNPHLTGGEIRRRVTLSIEVCSVFDTEMTSAEAMNATNFEFSLNSPGPAL